MSSSKKSDAGFPWFEEQNFTGWLVQFRAHLRKSGAHVVLDWPRPSHLDAQGNPIPMNAQQRWTFNDGLSMIGSITLLSWSLWKRAVRMWRWKTSRKQASWRQRLNYHRSKWWVSQRQNRSFLNDRNRVTSSLTIPSLRSLRKFEITPPASLCRAPPDGWLPIRAVRGWSYSIPLLMYLSWCHVLLHTLHLYTLHLPVLLPLLMEIASVSGQGELGPISNVLISDTIRHNCTSVLQLSDIGITVSFTLTGVTSVYGRREGGLYKLSLHDLLSLSSVSVCIIGGQRPDVDDLDFWHRCLADTSHRAIREAVQNKIIEGGHWIVSFSM